MSGAPPPYDARGSQSAPASSDEQRELPNGWLKQWDSNYQQHFYVDTKAHPPRSIWVHPLDDPEYQRQSGRRSPYAAPSGPPGPPAETGRMYNSNSSSSLRPPGSYGSGMAQQQGQPGGYYQGNGPAPMPQQPYYAAPQQQPYYPQQQQPPYPQQQQYQQPPRKSGFGGMGVPLALGGGLLGGALLGSAFENHEQYNQQMAYDQGYNNGFDQGGYDQAGNDGDFGGGGFDGGFDDGGGNW